MNPTIVDAIYERSLEILKYLDAQNEATFRSDFEEGFKKNLVLSISSYFEYLIGHTILAFVEKRTEKNEIIYNFIKHKALARQFHTFFDWEAKNANIFFSLFGPDFKKRCESKIKSDPEIDAGVRAFLELGGTRNLLVHLNFAEYQLPKTSEEYYQLYQKSLNFMAFVEEELNGFVR